MMAQGTGIDEILSELVTCAMIKGTIAHEISFVNVTVPSFL